MFKLNDKVRVVGRQPSNSIWIEAMDRTVGSVGEVVEIYDMRSQNKGIRYNVYFANTSDN